MIRQNAHNQRLLTVFHSGSCRRTYGSKIEETPWMRLDPCARPEIVAP
jgi:hypothetical protein